MTLWQGNGEVIRYEVKEIGATGLRMGGGIAAIFKNFLGTSVLSGRKSELVFLRHRNVNFLETCVSLSFLFTLRGQYGKRES